MFTTLCSGGDEREVSKGNNKIHLFGAEGKEKEKMRLDLGAVRGRTPPPHPLPLSPEYRGRGE
jgi:hypothetical protein